MKAMADRDQHMMSEAGVRLIGALFAMAAMVAAITAAAYATVQLAGWWIALSAAALGPAWVTAIFGPGNARPALHWMLGLAATGILVGLCAGWGLRRLLL